MSNGIYNYNYNNSGLAQAQPAFISVISQPTLVTNTGEEYIFPVDMFGQF